MQNTHFLQNVIINRTDDDHSIRGTISVSISNDSAPDAVAEILSSVA